MRRLGSYTGQCEREAVKDSCAELAESLALGLFSLALQNQACGPCSDSVLGGSVASVQLNGHCDGLIGSAGLETHDVGPPWHGHGELRSKIVL